jgi:hypothetical protein
VVDAPLPSNDVFSFAVPLPCFELGNETVLTGAPFDAAAAAFSFSSSLFVALYMALCFSINFHSWAFCAASVFLSWRTASRAARGSFELALRTASREREADEDEDDTAAAPGKEDEEEKGIVELDWDEERLEVVSLDGVEDWWCGCCLEDVEPPVKAAGGRCSSASGICVQD